MKIAFIGQKGIPATFGGVERHVEELATRLAKDGHDVNVYCRKWYTQSLAPDYQGVNLLYTKSVQTKNLDAITGTFTATLDALPRGFDIIHYHGVGPALLSFIPRIFSPQLKLLSLSIARTDCMANGVCWLVSCFLWENARLVIFPIKPLWSPKL